jgi:acyl-CoA synthetase (AMP-forming)/AMP-acid ligase II
MHTPLASTMQDFPLTSGMILRHGLALHGASEVATFDGDGVRRVRYAQVGERIARLAAGLSRLGVRPGDRVATFCWNTQEHLEAYFAVPTMGAVLHTLNIRLFPEQLAYIANHAEDKVVIVDDSLVPVFARVIGELKTVEQFVVVGRGEAQGLANAVRYDELIARESGGFAWPELDERSAAALCYTSGTTGNPRGVLYSHRSTVLHAFGFLAHPAFRLTEHDKIFAIASMFHANAWGLPHTGWLVGADFLMPGRFLQAEALCRLIASERPTFAGAVPTIWSDLLRYGEEHPVDFSSLTRVICGGSAVPATLIQRFEERHGVRIIQAWGMTETSPAAAVALPPRGARKEDEYRWRARTGRLMPGVEARIVGEGGEVLPTDGVSVGEIEVRGPWVTGAYYRDPCPQSFDGGWLRTGDVGSLDGQGYLQISDRAKDVIKSGGEWISSVALENELLAHPEVAEVAVIAVEDARWGERPLVCVVAAKGKSPQASELCAFLAPRVAKWWLPERWAFVKEIPKTSVGKLDKKRLRAMHVAGEFDVVRI